jgi:Holliday junction resolvasome RuvABC endonuclease subunit
MMNPEIQARIDQLYADMKPLMDQYGIKPMTIEERYERIQKQKQALAAVKLRPKPRWKL